MAEQLTEHQQTDRRNLREAVSEILKRWPDAKRAQFETSDQDTYGFRLQQVFLDDTCEQEVASEDFDAEADTIQDLVMDLDWDDVMAEDDHGHAIVDLTLHRLNHETPGM